MAEPIYRLGANLFGHTSDVRALTTLADGSIVSASRDRTTRLWKPSGDGKNYIESAVMKGHTNFVGSVCAINPSNRYPKGFIVTGSNDKTICVYATNEIEPLHRITAHDDTVSNLKTGLKEEGTFFSSSWDKTVKLWTVDNLVKPSLTLKGHSKAVWCGGDLSNGLVVTGGADNLVIIWSRQGDILFKLTGHTDCIRDFVAIKDDEFLTCANDATICHWKASLGTCLGSYSGHYNFIYSIAATPNGTYVFTCSEDKTVRIWYNGEEQQTLTLPCETIWCIGLLKNNDIVTGASDGTIRIFTRDSERQADEDTLIQFEKEVQVVTLKSQVELGGIQIKDLPDSTGLREPGKTDGQTKMIREDNIVRAYSWSSSESRWIRMGDVMGASGGNNATLGKQLYNGVEYDYVFSIDIQDGVPALKLPYNLDQDPWHAAQKFLHDNDLSQLYLDQVANFIVKNSQQSTSRFSSDAQYSDPFTGGSRYISNPEDSSMNSTVTNTFIESQSYIPHTKYLRLEQANIAAILDKLRDLNGNQNKINRIADEQLECLSRSLKNFPTEQVSIEIIDTLNTLLSWPSEVLFPVLDVTRLVVLQKQINERLCTSHLFQIVKKHLKPDAMASNQMLTYRLLANMFSGEKGETLGLDSKEETLQALLELSSLGNKNNQVAISTYLLNLIIALNKNHDTSNGSKVLDVIFALLPRFNEPEAKFRILVGLGTLLAAAFSTENRDRLIDAVRQSETAVSVLRTLSEITPRSNSENKLADCSKEIIDLIL